MTFPSSGLTGYLTQQFDMTAAQASAALANGTNPIGNTLGSTNAQAPPSISLAATGYGAQQGQCANQSADPANWIPQAMVGLQSMLFTMAATTYRM